MWRALLLGTGKLTGNARPLYRYLCAVLHGSLPKRLAEPHVPSRLQLAKALASLEKGDTLACFKLDRIGRSCRTWPRSSRTLTRAASASSRPRITSRPRLHGEIRVADHGGRRTVRAGSDDRAGPAPASRLPRHAVGFQGI